MVQFVDYEEIYAEDLFVLQSPQPNAVNLLYWLQISPYPNPLSELSQRVSKLGGNGFSMVIGTDEAKPEVELSADRFKLLPFYSRYEFSGNVRLKTRRCLLESSAALWSASDAGVYFPGFHVLNGKPLKRAAMYQISDSGQCRSLNSSVAMDFTDPLEQTENSLMGSLPLKYQLLFGLLGGTSPLAMPPVAHSE